MADETWIRSRRMRRSRDVGGGSERPAPSTGGSSVSDDVFKRRAYLVASALQIVLLATLIIAQGTDRPYWGIAYPLLLALAAVMCVGLWRRWLSLHVFEAVLLIVLVGTLFGFLVIWRAAPSYLAASVTVVYLVMMWSGMAFPLCFLVFGTRRGLQIALGVYGVFVLLAVPPVTGSVALADAQVESTVLTLSMAVFFAVMITLLWILASRLEALATARTAAKLHAQMASTDALTGLPNRRQLDDELDRHIALARRHRAPLSVAVVDIDHFKVINDQHGHEVGDLTIQAFASRLAGAVRAGDLVGRWGGEEFLVIAPHTDQRAVQDLAERCRAEIADTPLTDVGDITASFGVATLEEGQQRTALLRRADAAMYAAKHNGRNTVVAAPQPVALTAPR